MAEAAELLLQTGAEPVFGCARGGLQLLASTGLSAYAVRLRMLASCSSSWCMMPRCLACMHACSTLQGLRNAIAQALLLVVFCVQRADKAGLWACICLGCLFGWCMMTCFLFRKQMSIFMHGC